MGGDFKALAEGFSLGERLFPWGTTVAALRAAFAGVAPLTAYEPSSMRYPCAQAYGFAATVFYARGPAEDRPVLNLSIDLAPYAGRYDGIRAVYWLDAIHAGLGRPERVYDCNIARPPGASGVVYSASWISGGAHLSFSLYGGFRDDPGGRAVAGLFIGWHDEPAAAAPFMPAAAERDRVLDGIASGEAHLRIFELRSAQRPFTTTSGYPPPPSPPDDSLRQAQRVLRKPALHRTPPAWSARLRDHEIALWRSADGAYWGLANRWDAVAFRGGEVVLVRWMNTLPAKGGGGMSLTVGDFGVEEPHSSAPLRDLVTAMQPLLRRTVVCEEGYDC